MGKKKHNNLIVVIAAGLAIIIVTGLFQSADTAVVKPAFANKSPAHEKTVQIDNKTVVEFWDKYERGCGVSRADNNDDTVPPGVTFQWTAYRDQAKYTLLISEKPSMKNVVKYKVGKKRHRTVYGLKRNQTYYWSVSASYKGRSVRTKTTRFITADYPRILKVKKVKNIRDVGGDKAAGGKRVRQGVIYRSGHLSKITSSGKTYLKKKLKIKTELDLRNQEEVKADKNINPLKITYIHLHLAAYENIYTQSEYAQRLVEIMKLFADKNNYPIVIHCAAGKDRTGTLVFMLGGLLGVSGEDLCRGWELSFLTDASGSQFSKTLPSEYEKRFDALFDHFNKDGNLQENIEEFLLENGMTQEELDQIRANLLR